MSVSEFLASLPEGEKECYRLTNDHECHNGFQYHDGVNQLPSNEKFNPSGICQSGGLYFFTKAQLDKYKNNVFHAENLKWIRQVSFDHSDVCDARIYRDPGGAKYKCDKFFLGERKEFFIDDFVKVTSEIVLSFHTRHVRWTRELALATVKQDGYGFALQFVPEILRDREMCLTAVNQYGWVLQCVPELLRDREMCLAAVNQNVSALRFVPKSLRKETERCMNKQ